MDEDHVVDSNNVDSIFTLFDYLTGENNQNPKYCLKLVNCLRGAEFNVGSASNLEYSVKRLVRGLGSTKLFSQCGCFAALTSALKYKACTVENVLAALDKEQKPGKGVTKSEIKALNTACVLSCGAIIHSRQFSSQPPDVQENILHRLFEAGKTKSYLSSVIYQFVVDVVNLADDQQFKRVIWPLCKTSLLDNNLISCDANYLLLSCHKKHYKIVSKFIEKNSTVDSFIDNVAKNIFSNHVKLEHPVYESFANYICTNSTITKIWPKLVSEYARNETGLLVLFSHILKHTEVGVVPKLLVTKFIEVIIKLLSFKNKNREDSLLAKTVLSSMIGELCKNGIDDIRFQTVKKLLLYPANMKFELRTGTKCVQTLVAKLSSDYVKKLANLYRQILSGDMKKKVDEEGTEELWNSKEKQHVMHIYTRLLNHPALKNDLDWKLDQVKFIFDMSVTKNQAEVQKCAKDSFYKAIMLQFGTLKDLVKFLDNLAVYVSERIGSLDASEDVRTMWDKMYGVVETLNKKPNKLYNAVHVLLLYMGLYLFSDEELAKNGIEEILSCYQHLKKKKCEDEPHWTEVTVDLMLSLLSRENKLWRHVVSCVFPQIVPQMTPTALQQIINALDPKQNVLSNIESDSESDGASESETEEEEEEEEEDDDEEYKPNDQLRLAVRNALGYSAAATDDESVDMDQMGSDEERRLNESLSEAFRMFRAKQNTKKRKQSKEEETLLHFRLRVLDLIEIYLTNAPSMGGCLDLLLPLLDIYELSIKDNHQKPLQNRLDSILKHLSGVKTFSNTDGIDQTIVKDVFQAVIGRKETSALMFVEMSPRISDAATFLVRCSQLLAKDGIPLLEEYVSLLQSFCYSRDLKIPISMFQSVLRMSWEGNFKMAATLLELLSNSKIRIFKKMKIIEMLRIFYKNDQLHETASEDSRSELAEAESGFVKNFINLISDYDKAEKQHQHQQLSFLSNVITLMNVILTKKRTKVKKSPWKALISKMAEMEIINANKKTRCQLANIAHLFNITLRPSQKANRKRTASQSSVVEDETKEENEEEKAGESEEKKKKKRKMSAETMKLKKESRKLRENFSSDGLDVIRFSTVDSNSLFDADVQEEPEEEKTETKVPKKKKKKKEVNGVD